VFRLVFFALRCAEAPIGVEDGDEIESSDELVNALEQGKRDKANSRKPKDTKPGVKSIEQKAVQSDTPNSKAKIKRSGKLTYHWKIYP
jgi:hypothetical protein